MPKSPSNRWHAMALTICNWQTRVISQYQWNAIPNDGSSARAEITSLSGILSITLLCASNVSEYPFGHSETLVGAHPKPPTARYAVGQTCLSARLFRFRWSLLPAHPRGKFGGAVSRAPVAPVTARFFIWRR